MILNQAVLSGCMKPALDLRSGVTNRLPVFLTAIAIWLWCPVLLAQQFPPLTAAVVDLAALLDEQQEQALIQTLSAHEAQTSNQIVIATLPDLDGYDIADYANRLGRHWQIGTSENDNGVLMLVAPNQRKVRIEVGYGLEGALTDSLSSIIIQREVLPQFRKNDYPTGITNGVNAIIQAIDGEYTAPTGTNSNEFVNDVGKFMPLIFIAMVAIPEILRRLGLRKAANGAFPAGFTGLAATLISGQILIGLAVAIAIFLFIFLNSKKQGQRTGSGRGGYIGTGGIGGGGFGGGGSFGGGGGSFGGGGASGSW
ncbi:MAG: YgcG family protein [Granulosicoccus sp.]